MRLRLALPTAGLLLAGACVSSEGARREPGTDTAAARAGAGAAAGAATATAPAAGDSSRATVPIMPRPAVLRGLYVNRWAVLGQRMWELIDVAKRTEVNALVLDVKDDRGFTLYRSRVPLAQQIGADTTRPLSARRLRAVLDTMRAHGIFPIARIVVVKDPLLAVAKPEWSIKRRSDGAPWLDKNGKPWLDAHSREVWAYAADLADEAIDLGFSEVQYDYVRFPDEKRLVSETVFPLAKGRVRAQVIRDQLGFLHGRLKARKVPMSIDVFGLTTSDTTDMGIGQRWESFVDQADYVLPMTYPSHYAPGSYRIAAPNARPYATLDHALRDAKRRSAGIANAGEIVPWYQDFTLGPPRYGVEQVRAQIQAGYDNGVRSWLLWNPGSRYTLGALKPAILSEAAESPKRGRGAGDSTRAAARAPTGQPPSAP